LLKFSYICLVGNLAELGRLLRLHLSKVQEINTLGALNMFEPTQLVKTANLNELSTLELAQALMERLTISANDWHRLKSNRKVRASEQTAALVFQGSAGGSSPQDSSKQLAG